MRFRLGRSASGGGGTARIIPSAVSETRNVAMSIPNTAGSPSVAMSRPPSAGPPIRPIWKRSESSAPAAVSSWRLDESRSQRVERRAQKAAQPRGRRLDDEEHPDLGGGHEGVDEQRGRAEREAELRDAHHLPAVDGVREGAADDGREQERHERGEARKPTTAVEPVSW